MEKKKIIKSKKEIVDDVICDSCGKSCVVDVQVVNNKKRLDHGETDKVFEYMELSARWGYFSDKDLEKWTAQICEKCVDKKFPFIKFKKEQYNPIRPE